MATIHEVAHLAKVSTATVSRVINASGYVSEELTQRVLEAIQALNYQPNEIARSLTTGQSRGIGLVLPDISNPFFATITKGVQNALWKEGLTLIVCDTDEDPLQQEKHINILASKRIDGLLIVPTLADKKTHMRLSKLGTPFVYVDRYPIGLKVNYVGSDNQKGSHEAMTYLLSGGHVDIGILLADRKVSTSLERLAGYKTALKDKSIWVNNAYIAWGCYDIQKSCKITLQLLNNNPKISAIFCTNSPATIGALMAIRSMNIKYPEEISIVGFDEIPLFDFLERKITTVSQDAYRIGTKAAELLLKQFQSKSLEKITQEIIPCKFVEGTSVTNKNHKERMMKHGE